MTTGPVTPRPPASPTGCFLAPGGPRAISRVVVTGIGIVSPLGLTRDVTWRNLLAGVSGIDRVTRFNAEGFETTIAGEVKGFKAEEYMPRKDGRRMDRFSQFAVAASLEAVRHAGLENLGAKGDRAAAIVASSVGGISTLSEQIGVLNKRGPKLVSPLLVPKMLPDMASAQVSIALGIRGRNFSPTSACASGGDAIGHARCLLQSGAADIVLAGGTDAAICPIAFAAFNSARALSKRNAEPSRACRPFDVRRDGFVLGEGAAVMVMETMESAKERGARGIAEVAGYGATSDAYHITQPRPDGEGAVRAMRLALQDARMAAEDVSYVNAHGTSTVLNDRSETVAMKRVFGEHAYRMCISSTKSMTGHLLGASGALEAAVSVQAIENAVAPPTINLEEPDPQCDLDYVPRVARRGRLRAAMSNCFGFGGHNSCLIFRTMSE